MWMEKTKMEGKNTVKMMGTIQMEANNRVLTVIPRMSFRMIE